MVFGFNNKDRGYGFGPMPGFNRKKKGTIAKGNWDRDPKSNRKDCEPFNFKKQDSMWAAAAEEGRREQANMRDEEYSCSKCGKKLNYKDPDTDLCDACLKDSFPDPMDDYY